jgi:hypothetical protein
LFLASSGTQDAAITSVTHFAMAAWVAVFGEGPKKALTGAKVASFGPEFAQHRTARTTRMTKAKTVYQFSLAMRASKSSAGKTAVCLVDVGEWERHGTESRS